MSVPPAHSEVITHLAASGPISLLYDCSQYHSVASLQLPRIGGSRCHLSVSWFGFAYVKLQALDLKCRAGWKVTLAARTFQHWILCNISWRSIIGNLNVLLERALDVSQSKCIFFQRVEPAPTHFTCQTRPLPVFSGVSQFTQRSVAPMVKMTRSKTFQAYLPSCHRTYSCIHCRAHLANHDELISKSFQGSQGRAYLFNSVVNVGCGPAEERVLLTGLHAVADIYCENCKTTLGWKYEHAFESSQKYKEGKYIIELAHMIKDNGWD
ncbi:Hypothetical predicted protein [Pelobates cultripes]|uniref:Yippee domain-containing protein n=1 Tax=Pelobates cultripes TaxID=61616 RepID=A0AAD1R336_PELCU|nr:Hypothetical predicted protein [Pelobates cultripes]